jgi:FemAB family protein
MTRAEITLNNWQARFKEGLESCGIEARLRKDSLPDWTTVGHHLAYYPVVYSNSMIDYQLAYWQGNVGPVEDASLILIHDNRPCGVWPLSIAFTMDGPRLGSNGGVIIPPLFIKDLAEKTIKGITKACLNFINYFASQAHYNTWESAEEFSGSFPMSEWHHQSLRNGGASRLEHMMYVDLSLELSAVKSRFRKSFKSLITTGYKLWSVEILNAPNQNVWNDFKNLHHSAAGRLTRSEASWMHQYRATQEGNGFLVYLRDPDSKLVGGAFFNITRDEGYYSVGAYERALFDKPIGHVIQYHAIAEMLRLGMRWYRIGMRPYAETIPTPTAKQMSIADFKQGFSTHLFPAYRIRHWLPVK